MKAFGKMKHGFPLYSPEGEKAIFIYMGSKTKTKRIQTNLDEEFISKLVLTLESIHNGALNLSGIVASKGINKS